MESALEHLLTSSYKRDLISHIHAHPEDFGELVALAVADKQPYSWRAAWLLWSCMETNDPRVRRYIGKIVDALSVRPDNQLREFLIILRKLNIPEKYQGRVFDRCITIWEAIGKQPSVRHNAFALLFHIAKQHPELAKELLLMTDPRYTDTLSPGVKNSISRMRSALRG